MPVEKPRGLFITGTDTGVGKTLVAAGLARVLTERQVAVGVMKPVETGVENPQQLGPDAALLKWAATSSLADDKISPYRFRQPLAPSVAASKEQAKINYNSLILQARELIETHQFTIIEGAGGLMVPLAGGFLMADFAAALKLPLLVVCRPNLGTINHTLLTLFAARNMGLPVAGYLLNNMPQVKTMAEETAAHTLATLTADELVGILNHTDGNEQQKVLKIAKQITSLPTLSLLTPYLPEAADL